MPSSLRLCAYRLAPLAALLALAGSTAGQNAPAVGPNSDPTYQQLRNLALGSESIAVESVDLKRDAATFHLKSGTVCFVPPVNGKVTGAVFVGDGSMTLDPPTPDERRSLKLLTKGEPFDENFQHLVLRFTDSTYDELKKAGGHTNQGGCDTGPLKDSQNVMRHRIHYNLDGRILEDVLRPEPGGLFVAFVHGKHYDDKLLYVMDPNGAPETAPEQIQLSTYDENKEGIWASFNISAGYKSAMAGAEAPTSRIHIDEQYLDTTIEGSAHLSATAKTTFVPTSKDSRVLPFDLFHTLRVQSVLGPDGKPLAFIQEDKNDDPDFFVVFPAALTPGDKCTITSTYDGKDAVINTGSGNYYPVAREDWYPASRGASLGDYTNFYMIFRIPKGMKMAASGSLISEKEEGGHNVTEWKSDVAQPLAGFQFGRMKVEEAKLTSPEFTVATYANEDVPDIYRQFQGGTMGNLSTVTMMKQPLSEAQFAIKLYSSYFGPLPFKRLSVTQQTACGYGQSWPDLVWLPICSFYDDTVRHQLGIDQSAGGYWDVVTPHEVSHQWWGQLVGFGSYRDQWMSEGFADFSASLFLQAAYGKDSTKMYQKFWNDEHKLIVEKNQFGYRAIDVGPVTMGYRLDNSKVGGNIGRYLIYPKGAYILQMVRMMMWSGQTGDQNFKAMMQDFVKTYSGRAATTEDFKAVLEKHMTPDMDMAGNRKMDWFFNEYVYGTALPSYSFAATFDRNPAGEVVFNYHLTQSGVDDNFVYPVPVYFELGDGRTIQLGRIPIKGNSTSQGKVAMKGLKDPPKRALINYNFDMLAAN
jgi:Peptidase family M1 domain